MFNYKTNTRYFFNNPVLNFVNNMEKHRGNVLKRVLKTYGMTKTQFAIKMNCDRGTIYNYLKDPDLPADIFLRAGKILKYDFSADLPELKQLLLTVSEPQEAYGITKKMEELLKQKDELIQSLRQQLILKDQLIEIYQNKSIHKRKRKAA